LRHDIDGLSGAARPASGAAWERSQAEALSARSGIRVGASVAGERSRREMRRTAGPEARLSRAGRRRMESGRRAERRGKPSASRGNRDGHTAPRRIEMRAESGAAADVAARQLESKAYGRARPVLHRWRSRPRAALLEDTLATIAGPQRRSRGGSGTSLRSPRFVERIIEADGQGIVVVDDVEARRPGPAQPGVRSSRSTCVCGWSGVRVQSGRFVPLSWTTSSWISTGACARHGRFCVRSPRSIKCSLHLPPAHRRVFATSTDVAWWSLRARRRDRPRSPRVIPRRGSPSSGRGARVCGRASSPTWSESGVVRHPQLRRFRSVRSTMAYAWRSSRSRSWSPRCPRYVVDAPAVPAW